MTIELSHGKARPSLPRASDLQPVESVANPTDGRDASGRFKPGNRVSVGNRFKRTLRKVLGDKASSGEAGIVASDARRVFSHILRSLPSDAAPVRALLAVHARHLSLHAFYSERAAAAGLDTEAGLAFLEVADRQSQRAERVLVTVHDLARVHAERAPARELSFVQEVRQALASKSVTPSEPEKGIDP
ncbi:MAG: hypothetical protein ABTD50_23310 [Polyangiaceae bacterium]|jgi:hypothetical protein